MQKIAVDTLGPFIRRYLELRHIHPSWPFCRLMDGTALSDLSALNMPAATCFFVALSLNHMTFDDELWEIASLRRIPTPQAFIGFALALGYQNTLLEREFFRNLSQHGLAHIDNAIRMNEGRNRGLVPIQNPDPEEGVQMLPANPEYNV